MPSQANSATVAGSCLCGAVTYEIDLPTLFCGHCHCSMCRRPHGASYVTWTAVPPNQFRITGGDDHLTTYASSELGRRQFCQTCGSQLFCWHDQQDGSPPTMIDVTVASLHGDLDRQPETHFYYDSRASWTSVHDSLPKLGGKTGLEPLPQTALEALSSGETMIAADPAARSNIELVSRYFEACNNADATLFAEVLADDCVHYFSPEGFQPVRGADSIANTWINAQSLSPSWQVDGAVAIRDQVAIEYSMSFRQDRESPQRIARGTEWYVIRDGRITEIRAYFEANWQRDTGLTGFPYDKRGYRA